MTRHLRTIVVMFCITALTAFASFAQAGTEGWGGGDGHCGCGKQHDKHGGKHRHHNFKHMEKKLGLTDAQKAQAKTIFQGNRDVVKPLYTSLHAERKNLQTLIHADVIDEAAIRAETAKISGIQADLNVNRAKVGAQFRAILTPAQLTILKAQHQKCQSKGDKTTAPAK